jgi:nucleoside-diphosphate-sugar epimerase
MSRVQGDIIVLGVGGKMGPSLARMAKRASDAAGVKRRVIGVSRFSTAQLPNQLKGWGVDTIPCDLLNQAELDKLPDVPNVVFMAGMKFGSTGQQARTWAMNTFLPGMVSQKFKSSKIVAFSTGNVYPMWPIHRGGCAEIDEPGPIGDYAISCLGRERIFEHFSRTNGTPMSIIRLNYAVEMRYGVLVDMARKVLAEEEVDLAMGNLNCIWQADANANSLQTFDHVASPPLVLNVTGPEVMSVRRICETFGELLGKEPRFVGSESGTALLGNSQFCQRLYGYPRVGPLQVMQWTAEWVKRGGESLGKPTHFETRDGKF